MAGVLDVLASYIENMLKEIVTDEVHMLLGVSAEIDKMSIKLGDLRNFLTDADRKNITDQSVQAWVKDLRDAMYDATNILDICQLKATEQGPTRDVGCFNTLLFCMRNPLHAHNISKRIKKLNQTLDEMKKRSLDFSFIYLNSYEDRMLASYRPCSRETSAELDESSLVGGKIEEDTRSLVEISVLKDIGMGIIEKCDGLPLAVKVLGGLLRQKKTMRSNWENVLNDSIWSASQMPQELNYAIYLSYQDLHPRLKPCFLYYALLPKSALFYADQIIGMWISEGLIHGNSHDLKGFGRQYYEELIWRILIEPDKRYTDQQVCNIHDVVRSFAHHVAKNEALVACRIDADIFSQLNSQKFIWISLETTGSESNALEWSSIHRQILLRTLISVGSIKFKPRDSLLSFSCLRTLHIESTNIDALAESLFRLKHLRYLSVNKTNISRLPERIGKMKFLQYISLFGCKSLVKLPDSIGKLQQLRVLNLSSTNIKQIPRGFGVLTNLRKLYGFPAQMDGDWCSLEELGPLSKLTEVHIKGLENVSSSSFASKAKLSEKVHLSYLRISCTTTHRDDNKFAEEEQLQIEMVFDELCPPPSVENLPIVNYIGRRLPIWMMSPEIGPLKNLRILTMIGFPCCTELPDGLCQLPCLESLEIDRAPSIKQVGTKFVQPYHHENLCHPGILSCIVELEVLESFELESICNLGKLQRLCVSMCPKLKVLEGMPALQSFMLEDYDMNTLPRYLKDINLRHLQIHCDISLLTLIAEGVSNPEWDKFNHIQQVKAYANDDNDHIPRRWYVSYTRDHPISFETNISPSAFNSGDGDGSRVLSY